MEINMVMDDLLSPEKLRYKSILNMDIDNKNISPYLHAYESFRLLIFGAYINNELIGAVYLTPYTFDRLYIEQLIVDKDKQKNVQFDIETALLDFVEKRMDDINDYYHKVFNHLIISASTEELHKVCASRGYILVDTQRDLMSKKVNRL